MKTVLRVLFLATAFCIGGSLNAQTLSEYTYSTGNSSTRWINLTTTTNLLTSGDGAASTVQNIGFSFPYGMDVYSQFSVNTDGNLRLGPVATGTGSYGTPFGSSSVMNNSPKINFLGCDGYLVDTLHYVYAENTTDNVGDSLLVVEFCLGTYTSSTRNQQYKWQVHLYPNGNITVVYPTNGPATAPAVMHQQGLCSADGEGWIIDQEGVATTFTNGSSTAWYSGYWPAPNTYYTFTRPVVTCPAVTAITVRNLTPTTASLSFTPSGTETQWLGTINPPIFGQSSIILSDTTANLFLLTPSTDYTISVRAICAVDDTSYARTITFRTPCLPTALPYQENFDSLSSGELPSCWNKLGDGTVQIWNSSSYALSGTNSIRFSGSYSNLVTLPLLSGSTNLLEMTFASRPESFTNSSCGSFDVGYLTNILDPNSFVAVATRNYNDTNAIVVDTVRFIGAPANAVIAFRHRPNSTSWYWFIDDVDVHAIPNFIYAASADNNLGVVTGTGYYQVGDTVTLTATPNPRCHFVRWNDGDTHAVRVFPYTEPGYFIAEFDYDSITITLVNPDTTMGTTTPAPGTYTFHVDDTVYAMATPNNGYSFFNWTVNLETLTDSINTNPIAFPLPTTLAGYSLTVTPNFLPINYTINVYPNDDNLGTVTGTGSYPYNSTATIAATPAANCLFVEWSDGDTNAVRTVLVTGNASYTATFQRIPQHTLTLTAVDNHGTVTGAGTYYEGESVTITATSNPGYHFIGWGVINTAVLDSSYMIFSHDSVLTFTMPENDQDYYALFEANPATATVAIMSNDDNLGYVLVNGNRVDSYHGLVGETIHLEAVATGSQFFVWTISDQEESYITTPTIDYTITENSRFIIAVFHSVGIDDVEADGTTIFSQNGNIIVRGAEQQTIRVYDLVGRMLMQTANAAAEETFRMERTGVYLVQVGNNAARRVIVRN